MKDLMFGSFYFMQKNPMTRNMIFGIYILLIFLCRAFFFLAESSADLRDTACRKQGHVQTKTHSAGQTQSCGHFGHTELSRCH